VRWNSQKTYLADIVAAGVPVVPTTFVAPGQTWLAPADDYVVKPAVGSGGWWAARYAQSAPEASQRHVASLHAAGQTVLLQPYQRAVDTAGETAMVFFGNQFSHAVHKAALLDADAGITDALWEREVITPIAPPGAHLEVAKAAMGAVAGLVGETCYARVDVIDGNDGTPVVLEVELIEPSLFMPAAEGSGLRFVEVLAGLLGS
jgi:glutathione synthase/RimK-type ligase-like ATP-grasp enzyme